MCLNKLLGKLPGFSLIEISIVLLIVGILVGAVLKGKDVMEVAQLNDVASDVQVLQMAYFNYLTSFGSIPGNDNRATARFGGSLQDGSGNGKTSSDEAKHIFEHLHAAGLIDSANFKMPKVGGTYDMVSEDGVVKLRLSKEGNGFLSRKQVVSLMTKITDRIGASPGQVESTPTEIKEDGAYSIKVRLN
jgi:prepilin-type N-terminal cleavage/methylation domain-containing protein